MITVKLYRNIKLRGLHGAALIALEKYLPVEVACIVMIFGDRELRCSIELL